tara:strand:- start:37910 stop:38455 length:546 start_codon:yes stop_codon:yes gene_type:complete
MITIPKQVIVRFNSSDPIEFSGDETPLRPQLGKDYAFGMEKVSDSTVILLDENPDSEGGIDRSEPIRLDRMTVVGEMEQIKVSRYKSGFAAPMTPEAKAFLEGEIYGHENMTVNEAAATVCDLNLAQGNLRQMDDGIFADIMELDDDADVTEIREGVESEIERLISDYGGHSLLREIIVWN